MTQIITHEIVVAFAQCPLKAFFLLRSEDQGTPHEYVRLLEEHARRNRIKYLDIIKKKHANVETGDANDLTAGEDMLIHGLLKYQDLEADNCDLYKIYQASSLGHFSYTPTIVMGTYQVTKEQKLALLFAGYVLVKMQKMLPLSGTIVGADGRAHKVGLESAERILKPIVDTLRGWAGEPPPTHPQMILNKHCSLCQFKMACLKQAEKEAHLPSEWVN
jgi:predicted RecB family nuclease